MRCELLLHRQLKKDLERIKKSGWPMERMKKALEALADGPPFPAAFDVHELQGTLKDVYDLHVAHNWLILFRYQGRNVIEVLRTGTHASINVTE